MISQIVPDLRDTILIKIVGEEFQFDPNHLENLATPEFHYYRDGIGHYEYWGFHGYDMHDCSEINDGESFTVVVDHHPDVGAIDLISDFLSEEVNSHIRDEIGSDWYLVIGSAKTIAPGVTIVNVSWQELEPCYYYTQFGLTVETANG